jgi:nucleoside-diphosphate-sugar epimerase
MADDRFAPVVLRFGTVFGLSGRTRFDLVVNLMTARAMFEHSIEVLGGEQWRPFVHVADAARAVVECLEAPLAVVRQKAFNVGSDEQNYTIKQVAQLVAASAPGTAIVDETNVRDRRNYRVSFKAIQTAIGFVPKWSLEQGIQQVIEAIRRGDVVDYRDPKYSNVRFLSEEGLLKLGRQELDWEQRLIRATPGLADQLRLERASKLVSS